MAIIRVLLNDEEIELTLERTKDIKLKKSDADYEIFVAKNQLFQEASIIIYSISGIVKSIVRNGDVTVFEEDSRTSGEVILQRAQEALTEFLRDEDSGVENDDEENEGGKAPGKIKPYDPDEIKVRSDKFSIEYVVNKLIAKGLLDLNPDYQRKFVWDRKRQSRLIESIMLGIPIPFMYLSESVGGKFNVVDGLQRLSTFRDFINNKFRLKDLEHLTQFEGCYFDSGKSKKSLDVAMQTRIEKFQLYFNIIDKTSPNEVKYDIFERLNTGGLPLNAQEIRNCNAEQFVREFLRSCSESEIFKAATDYSITGKRMDDQELVLRYAGFYLEKRGLVEYNGNMKQYLNMINEYLNKSPKSILTEMRDAFENSMRVNYHLFGKYAFRKCLPNDLLPGARKQAINKAMFVVWSVCCTEIDYEKLISNTQQEFLAPILAESMLVKSPQSDNTYITDKSEYNRLLTTGTFDVKNIKVTFARTREILHQNNLINA